MCVHIYNLYIAYLYFYIRSLRDIICVSQDIDVTIWSWISGYFLDSTKFETVR